MIKTINSHETHSLIMENKAVLIDVREPDEYQSAHIKGAILMPLSGVSVERLPSILNKTLVIQCRSGGRSLEACKILLKQNPRLDVYNLEGGIIAWINAGLEIVAAEE